MKQLCFALTLLFCLIFLCPIASAAWEAPSPGDAAAAFMEQVREWDPAPVQAVVDTAWPGDYGEAVCRLVLTPALARLEYDLGNEKITGRSAAVDLAVTAADLKTIATDITAQAIGCAAIRSWTGIPLDVEGYVTNRIAEALDSGSLTTIRTNTTLYLTAGGDGQWKVDMTDMRNLDFLEALTGGMVDFEGALGVVSAMSGAVEK